MINCLDCGRRLTRRHRTAFEKLFYRSCFRCDSCGAQANSARPLVAMLHEFAECPKCSTRDVSKLRRVDKIDRMSKNPFRYILRAFGAPLYHCNFCRIQFYDWRPKDSRAAPQPLKKTEVLEHSSYPL